MMRNRKWSNDRGINNVEEKEEEINDKNQLDSKSNFKSNSTNVRL